MDQPRRHAADADGATSTSGCWARTPPSQQRLQYYARTLAAKTEFWRAHRKCAGVLHFCGLGYSRPDGQTSDNFIDVKNLVYEPNFFRYVRDAFAPVGVMLDFWDKTAPAGQPKTFRVLAINDTPRDWSGTLRLRILKSDRPVAEASRPLAIAALGQTEGQIECAVPKEPGDYVLEAALVREGDPPVRSLRDVRVVR